MVASKADQLVLGIVIRNDIPDMTPGRAIAQGSHATSEFHAELSTEAYREWADDGYFGTALVFSGNERQLLDIIASSHKTGTTMHGITKDRSYKVETDGDIQYVPMITALWIFGPRKDVSRVCKKVQLF